LLASDTLITLRGTDAWKDIIQGTLSGTNKRRPKIMWLNITECLDENESQKTTETKGWQVRATDLNGEGHFTCQPSDQGRLKPSQAKLSYTFICTVYTFLTSFCHCN